MINIQTLLVTLILGFSICAIADNGIESKYVGAYYEAAKLAEIGKSESKELTRESKSLCNAVKKDLASSENKVMALPEWDLKNCELAFKKFKLGSCTDRKANLARVTLRAALTKHCGLQ